MKKKEKIYVFILIVIAVIAICVYINSKKGDSKDIATSNQPISNTNINEPVNGELKNEVDIEVDKDLVAVDKGDEYVKRNSDGSSLNISNKLSESKKIGNLSVGNMKLVYKNNKTVISCDLKNMGDTRCEKTTLKLSLTNKDLKPIISGMTIEVAELEAKGSTPINITIEGIDLSNAYDFTITAK